MEVHGVSKRTRPGGKYRGEEEGTECHHEALTQQKTWQEVCGCSLLSQGSALMLSPYKRGPA